MRHALASLASLAAPLAAVSLAAAPAAAQPSSPAFAPPGACGCETPAPAAAAAPELPRWAIGLRLTSLAVHPKDAGADSQTRFGGGGIELRYRLAPAWELAAAAEGGREQLADGTQGDLAIAFDTLTVRYHPWPYAGWDLYGIAGVGAAAIRPADAQASSDDVRGAGELGVGVEHRFGHLGIGAELRAIGLAAPKATTASGGGATMPPVSTTGTPPPPVPAGPADASLSGGALTLSAAYHF